MTDEGGATPAERRASIAEAIVAHRNAGHESAIRFVAGEDGDAVDYEDRLVTLRVDDSERERLDALLEEFTVFKIAQPDTRKAPEGVVHVSAIADPKHAADFLDRLFLDVFAVGEGYELVVET